MSDFTGLEDIDALLAASDEGTNRHGNATRYAFLMEGERYLFDLNLDQGWSQFDSTSDAWYFGIWLCKDKLRLLTYAEGDVEFTQCKDAESFDTELAVLCCFHKPKHVTAALGEDGSITRYYEDRRSHFIDPARYPQDLRDPWETDEASEPDS